MGLGFVDTLVLVIYLVAVTALGISVARRVTTIADFFMPRRFGKAMMITHAFGTGTASDHAVIVASGTFRSGLSGIWYQWMYLFCTPFYWLIAPIMRRFRAVTTADVFTLRFDASVAVLYALVGIVGLSVKIGLLLKTSSVLIDAVTGGLVDADLAIAVVSVLFVAYGAAGGLGAAILTDFFQGVLTIVFSFLLLPFVLGAVGGMEGVRRAVADPAMLSLVSPGEIGLFFVVMFALQALVGIVAQPFIMGICGAGRTELDGRVGFMVGNIVKRLCTVPWTLVGIGAFALYLGRGIDPATVDPDSVYGDMAREFLPKALPGLLGLFLACLLASVMNSCDSYMVSSAGLLTKNVYKPLFPRRTERHYLVVARVASVAVVAGGLAFAYVIPNVVKGLMVWMSIAPMMGIAFWLGLLWRRTTVAGAWTATLVGFGTWFVSTRRFVVDAAASLPFAEELRLVWTEAGKEPALYEPWRIAIYLAAAAVAAIAVSLFTRPVSAAKLERFYALVRTPVRAGEDVREPCTLPVGATPPERRMLCSSFGLEIPVPSRTSILGFLAGWVLVAALIAGFVAIVSA